MQNQVSTPCSKGLTQALFFSRKKEVEEKNGEQPFHIFSVFEGIYSLPF